MFQVYRDSVDDELSNGKKKRYVPTKTKIRL